MSPIVSHALSLWSLYHHSAQSQGNNSLKVVQKLLINTIGNRDYLTQETCHFLLQLPMFKASWDFILLSLDGSHAVEDRLDVEQHATAPSIIDHYFEHPSTVAFSNITLLEFSHQYTMPKTLGTEPTRQSRQVVVNVPTALLTLVVPRMSVLSTVTHAAQTLL